jgi:hypothetical protein
VARGLEDHGCDETLISDLEMKGVSTNKKQSKRNKDK